MIEIVNEIAVRAGREILKVYNDPSFFLSTKIERKSDHSPVTVADKKSNDIIACQLKHHFPEIPILSEEEKFIDYECRKDWKKFWLIDPLDGTKEFIKRNDEFTINIALIENGIPVLGVIYAPVYNSLYYCYDDLAFKKEGDIVKRLVVRNRKDKLIAVRSRSHSIDKEDITLKMYDVCEFMDIGSSLKFCMIAEGKADIYVREHPTMEWDTAAGHAIVLAAGGRVQGLNYNKPSLMNGSFQCFGFH